MIRKAIKITDRALDIFIVIILLLFSLVCIYVMVDSALTYYHANNKNLLKYKPALENVEPLRKLGKDAVAWISVDDTKIDYPVMQGKTNEEYINKDPFGEFSLSGSIFLDSRNKRDFSDPYSIVYGHHMEYGAMFGALDEFIKPAYFKTHTAGELITVYGGNYDITFFACAKATANNKSVFDTKKKNNSLLLKYLSENALVYRADIAGGNSQIIALSTCSSAQSVERLVLFGVLTKKN